MADSRKTDKEEQVRSKNFCRSYKSYQSASATSHIGTCRQRLISINFDFFRFYYGIVVETNT